MTDCQSVNAAMGQQSTMFFEELLIQALQQVKNTEDEISKSLQAPTISLPTFAALREIFFIACDN
jgi:hypothetical protein